jgi:hypothetical protein
LSAGTNWDSCVCCRDYECVLSIDQGFKFLALEWAVYLILAIYLDNVVPNEFGVRKK